MIKLFTVAVAIFFMTLAVVTAVETVTRPTAPQAIETRTDRRKRMR